MSSSKVSVKTKRKKTQEELDREEAGPSSRPDPVQRRRSLRREAAVEPLKRMRFPCKLYLHKAVYYLI